MTKTLRLEDLTLSIPELVDSLAPGEEVILTRNAQPVAKLVSEASAPKKARPAPGLCKGMIVSIAPDFDAPLEDLQEYM